MGGYYQNFTKEVDSWWQVLFARVFVVDPGERANLQEIKELLEDNPYKHPKQQNKSRGWKRLGKSTKDWLKALTNANDEVTPSTQFDKILLKAWKKPNKIVKFFRTALRQACKQSIIALKSLISFHKYLIYGPRRILELQAECQDFLKSVNEFWCAQTSHRKKDKFISEEIIETILMYCEYLKKKLIIHYQIQNNANWRGNCQIDNHSTVGILSYLEDSLTIVRKLYTQLNSIPITKSSIIKLAYIESHGIIMTFNSNRQYFQPHIGEIDRLYHSLTELHSQQSRGIFLIHLPPLNPSQSATSHNTIEQQDQNIVSEEFLEQTLSPTQASTHGSNKSNVKSQQGTNSSIRSSEEPSTPTSIIPDEYLINSSELQFEDVLGQGATSVVYRGLFRYSPVAIKQMNTERLPHEVMKEFNREVVAMTKLRHPNLVLFMGACFDDKICIMTEYCQGGTIFNLLHERPEIEVSWQQRLKIAKDVAYGMAYLHSAKPPIIHRDLKSLNLLVRDEFSGPNDQITVKITDFGVSRFFDNNPEFMTGQMGTCHWMAPEVLLNQPYSLAADVYSYGIVLWEIAARVTPYIGTELTMIPYQVVHLNIRPDIRLIDEGCPNSLKSLMARCWDKSPDIRPTFGEIVKILNSIVLTK